MSEMEPKIKKVSQDRENGKFLHRQAKSSNFIRKK